MDREPRGAGRTISLVLLGMILGWIMLSPVSAYHTPRHTKKQIEAEEKARKAADAALDAKTVWAKVDADVTGATVLAGDGAVSVTRAGPGNFEVLFVRAVDKCGWNSTLNDNATGISPPGESSVHLSPSDPKKLVVRIYNSHDGTPTDPADPHGFTVVANC